MNQRARQGQAGEKQRWKTLEICFQTPDFFRDGNGAAEGRPAKHKVCFHVMERGGLGQCRDH